MKRKPYRNGKPEKPEAVKSIARVYTWWRIEDDGKVVINKHAPLKSVQRAERARKRLGLSTDGQKKLDL